MDLVTQLGVLVLAAFVGFEVISKVPNTLHTPLMSGTNAIHGIVILGGLLVLGTAAHSTLDKVLLVMGHAVIDNDTVSKVLLVIAVIFGTINVVGGFLVTDRMLGMFKRKPEPARTEGDAS